MHNLAQKQTVLKPHVKRVLLACRDAIRANYPTAEIVLYGSQACGRAGPESDMDLLILFKEDLTPGKKRIIRDMLYDIALAEDVVISAIIRSYDTWYSPISKATPLYRIIHQEGIQVV